MQLDLALSVRNFLVVWTELFFTCFFSLMPCTLPIFLLSSVLQTLYDVID